MAKQTNKSAEFLPFSCAYVYPKDYNATSNLSLASTPKTYDVGYTQAQHQTKTDLLDTFNAEAERMRSKTYGYSFRFGLLDFISPLTLVKIGFKFRLLRFISPLTLVKIGLLDCTSFSHSPSPLHILVRTLELIPL